jgi:ferrous iron transport protein B
MKNNTQDNANPAAKDSFTIAISGNPNAGKSTIFNGLTGTMQHVSNYPGVTVAIKEGAVRHQGKNLNFIDLPGIYSLTAYSQEELVSRKVILEDHPDLVLNVLDASNLERNLYLATQIMEMSVPLVLALNMTDIAEKRGMVIDAEELSRLLGVPVVETVGNRGGGLDALLAACAEVLEGKRAAIPHIVTYGHELDSEVDRLTQVIESAPARLEDATPRWVAIKLIEGDPEVRGAVKALDGDAGAEIIAAAEAAVREIERHEGEAVTTVVAERRYGFAAGAIKECLSLTGEARQHITDQIDTVVCNRFFGPLFMVGVVAAMFFWVFKVSDEWKWIPWVGGWKSPTSLLEWLFEGMASMVAPLEESMPMIHSLLADAVIGGVGGVMGFVPLIFVMFIFVSALEDTGYIARVAFILDRALKSFGLQGKSILSMIVAGGLGAGGCAVPGVMATRTLREEKDRLVTMLVVPYMNCGAKMPVYAMLIAAFFTEGRTQMMLILWGISWAVALSAAWFFSKFVIRGEQTPFVMELPPYHVPIFTSVMRHAWDRTWMYIRKAGTIILAINIILWALMYFPRLPEEQAAKIENAKDLAAAELTYSVAGRLGHALEPVSQLAGFDWQTNIALIGGFAAKEIVVGTLGTAYSMGEVDVEESSSLSDRLAANPDWNPLRAFVLMVFVMVYAPCFITIAVIRRESGSWKWALFSTGFSTALAFVMVVIIYQVGMALGIGV